MRQRINNDVSELFSYMREFDDPADHEAWKWKAEFAFDIAQIAYEEAYRTGEDADAVAFTEDVAAPIVAYAHADGKKPDHDLDYWEDRLADIPGENRGMKIPPSSDRMAQLYDTVQDEFDPDEFDYVVGIFSAGMGPLYTVSEYFEDAEDVVIRYSKNRGDTTVTVTPTMEERLDAEAARILLVDDGLDKAGSLHMTGAYLTEQDAEEVQCLVAQAASGWPVMDAFEPAPYEAVKDAVENDEVRA